MKLYQTDAVVCTHYKLGESDRIISLYTQSEGQVSAVAKGVRKSKSGYAGRLEPISLIGAQLYRGKSLHTITEVELKDPFREIKADYDLLMAASQMIKLTERLGKNESHPGENFHVILEGLHWLSKGIDIAIALPVFNLAILHQSGHLPNFERCCLCNVELEIPPPSFSVEEGGFVCSGCTPNAVFTYGITGEVHQLLYAIYVSGMELALSDLNADTKEWTAVNSIIDAFLQYHLDSRSRQNN